MACIGFAFFVNWPTLFESSAEEISTSVHEFLSSHCRDCHAGDTHEGGFAIDELSNELSDPAVFARWELIFDRVRKQQMPPPDAEQPSASEIQSFVRSIGRPLYDVHRQSKSTVLRRLNRREYQNTLNDVFGTNIDLESSLPEDARAHEFDNVGDALGLSMVHLQCYMDAAKKVLDTTIANDLAPPKSETITAWYKDTREAERHVGTAWKQLDDGSMVRFSGGGYPSGMIRDTSVNQAGRYRIRVTGFAYQSDQPIVFSVGGTSFMPGSEQPIYGYFQVPPNQPTTVELEAWIEPRYMITIEPYGISDAGQVRKSGPDAYNGPGLAIGEVTLEGPLVDSFPLAGHGLIFDGINRREVQSSNPRDRRRPGQRLEFEIVTDDPFATATMSLRRVAQATFRRPVVDADLIPYVRLFSDQMESGESIEQSLRTSIIAMLCSPRFLFLEEPAGRLDDFAIASRLSYFLHRTLPDEALMLAAASGQLSDPNELRRQTERLLSEPKSERFVVDLTDSWLDLREIDFTAPDVKLFPEFDPFLRYSMPLETRAFVRDLIESNLPIANLVDSDFAMVNNRLAEHYKIDEVEGVEIRKVKLPAGSLRGGLLSQASILKVTANGTNTSPVVRGAWVMERIEGLTPPPPPPGVPGVEPDIRSATTLRELLEKHRNADNCRACHARIDPPGFAMEVFNPIGGLRDRYRSLGEGDRVDMNVNGRKVAYRLGPKVDASGELTDGGRFEDFRQFRNLLARQDEMLARTFVTKLLTFATGREMGFSDRTEINQIVAGAAKDRYRAKDLLHSVVASNIFQSK